MIDGSRVRDAKIAFVAGYRMPTAFEDVWQSELESTTGYRWVSDDDSDGVEAQTFGGALPAFLEDLRDVEAFYLNARSQLMLGDDRLRLGRRIPEFEVRIRHEVAGETMVDEIVDVVLTYYQTVNVLTVTLNFRLGEYDANDLIYLKSLKWDSNPSIRNARTVEMSYDDGENWTEVHFSSLFERVRERVFSGFGPESAPETDGDAVLDTISFRGFVSDDEEQREGLNGQEKRCLYGLVTGDEGHGINKPTAMDGLVSKTESKLDTRQYFEYFFDGTTVLARLDADYDAEKQGFADDYTDRYGSYPPYSRYLDLDPGIAALEDGMYLFGEIALVRFVLLRFVDEELEASLANEKDSSYLPFGRDLRDLEQTKRRSTTQLTNIDMLTNSVLGIGVIPSFDGMFGYAETKVQVREKLSDLDDSIQNRYNRRTQTVIIALTLVTILTTLVTILN